MLGWGEVCQEEAICYRGSSVCGFLEEETMRSKLAFLASVMLFGGAVTTGCGDDTSSSGGSGGSGTGGDATGGAATGGAATGGAATGGSGTGGAAGGAGGAATGGAGGG